MESIAIFESVPFENAKSMLRHPRLGGAAGKLLLLAEVSAALAILSWCSSRLPTALRWISAFFAGHVFCFLLSNAIILTLLATSGWLSDQSPSDSDLFKTTADSISEIPGQTVTAEAVSFQDKEMIVPVVPPAIAIIPVKTDGEFEFPKAFRRSKSARYSTVKRSFTDGPVLRRSETKRYCREVVAAGESRIQEEEMSNEEFQRKIDAFIAKQLKFRRQESISGVVDTCA